MGRMCCDQRAYSPQLVPLALALLFCLFCLAEGSPVVFAPSGTLEWNGNCATLLCTHVSPCRADAGGQHIWNLVSDACNLVFLGGNYGGATFSAYPNVTTHATINIATESSAVMNLKLEIGATESARFDLTILASYFGSSSSISIVSADHALINASMFYATDSIRVTDVLELTILGSTVSILGVPAVAVSGRNAIEHMLVLSRSVFSSNVSLLYANASQSYLSVTFDESSFSGPTFVLGPGLLRNISITTSLIVGISPYLFADGCNMTLLLMDGASIQGLSSVISSSFCPSSEDPIQYLIINDLTTLDFGLGEIETLQFNITNSDFSDLDGLLELFPSPLPSTLYGNTFRRSPASSSTLIIAGINNPCQTIVMQHNLWSPTTVSAPAIAFLDFRGLVDFGSGQLIPSLETNYLIFTGTLWITDSITSPNLTTQAYITSHDRNSVLRLSSISATNLHVSLTQGLFVYVPSTPTTGITSGPSSQSSAWWLGVPVSVDVDFNSSHLSLDVSYPIAHNVSANFQSIDHILTTYYTDVRLDAEYLSFTMKTYTPSSAVSTHNPSQTPYLYAIYLAAGLLHVAILELRRR